MAATLPPCDRFGAWPHAAGRDLGTLDHVCSGLRNPEFYGLSDELRVISRRLLTCLQGSLECGMHTSCHAFLRKPWQGSLSTRRTHALRILALQLNGCCQAMHLPF